MSEQEIGLSQPQSTNPATPVTDDKEKKKLTKSEQKLMSQLEEARKEHAGALALLQKAEQRLHKRTGKLQKVQAKLQTTRQMLYGEAAPPVEEIPNPPSSGRPLSDLRIYSQEELEQMPDPHVIVPEPVENARAASQAIERNVRASAERAVQLDKHDHPDGTKTSSQHALFAPPAIEEIREEEEMVSALASMMIAEASATAAAHAEAVAEEKSSRAEQARRRVHTADTALRKIQDAIKKQALSGDEADMALHDAERELAYAQISLAEAEQAEERARLVAMESHARMLDSGGMAASAQDHAEKQSPDRDLPEDLQHKLGEIRAKVETFEVVEEVTPQDTEPPFVSEQ